jgi:hypothetical protein
MKLWMRRHPLAAQLGMFALAMLAVLELILQGAGPAPQASVTAAAACQGVAGQPAPLAALYACAASLSGEPAGSQQQTCLHELWTQESGWRWWAQNPTSPAYGIPQADPGDKMASAGPDWRTNPVTQIRWGLGYIKGSYGTPCHAWWFENSHSPAWY